MDAVIARARGAVTTAARDVAAFALPQRCPCCGGPGEAATLLCAPCLAAVPPFGAPLCARCLARGAAGDGCDAHPAFRVWAGRVYDEAMAAVVHALKFEGRPRLATALAGVLASALPPAVRPDLVVAVPLDPARRRERGYNQAACLGRALAERLDTVYLDDALVRVRATRPQARLDPAARRHNVRGAFRACGAGRLRGREVVVVDDVITTGATLEACLAVLADAGARATGVAVACAT